LLGFAQVTKSNIKSMALFPIPDGRSPAVRAI
jgi:hypothetical protein